VDFERRAAPFPPGRRSVAFYAQRLTCRDIKELAEAIGRPPHRWTAERLWEAYETLDASKVRGTAGTLLTNIVSLVRYAIGADALLAELTDAVAA
jgi:type I restriction enzyme, R subunit